MYRDNNGESIRVVIRDKVFFRKIQLLLPVFNCFSYFEEKDCFLEIHTQLSLIPSIDSLIQSEKN